MRTKAKNFSLKSKELRLSLIECLMAGFVTTIITYPCNVLLEILKYQSTAIFNYITLFGFYFERDLMVKPKQHNIKW